MTCLVTGTAVSPDGTALANGVLRFFRTPSEVVSVDGVVVFPTPVVAVTSDTGAISVELTPGTYRIQEDVSGVAFTATVPDDLPTVDWAYLLTAAAIVAIPDVVQEVFDARDDVVGRVPDSPGGTTQFLRADGTWAVPAGGGGGGSSAWGDITGTLSAQADLQAALNLKASVTGVTAGLALKADATDLAAKADVAALALKANVTDVLSGLALKADTADLAAVATSGAISDVAGLQGALDGKADTGHTHAFADITDKPTTMVGFGITDATPIPFIKPNSGNWIANGWRATNGTIYNTGHLQGYWIAPFDMTISEVAIDVTTAGSAGVTAKVTIYDSDSTCRPLNLLAESPTVSVATTGLKSVTLTAPVVVSKGQVLWLGVRASNTFVYGAATFGNVSGMQVMASPTTGNRGALSRYAAYANPTQSPWVWNISEISGDGFPLVFMKAQ